MNPKQMISRREAVGMGTGMLAGSVLMAMQTGAATGADMNVTNNSPEVEAAQPPIQRQDPFTELPRPPFPRQHQDPPGLACMMEPRPDHGKKSY